MAGRYLRRMPIFNERGFTVLGNLLGERRLSHTPPPLNELSEKVSATQERLRVSRPHRRTFEGQIQAYWGCESPLPVDIALSMLSVMMYRHDVAEAGGPTLFEVDEESESEPSVAVAANPSVYEAAVFQLFHGYDRPYYYGINAVCDASSENAELFLRLSAELVEGVATQIARNRGRTLPPATQHKLLASVGRRSSTHGIFPMTTRFEFWLRKSPTVICANPLNRTGQLSPMPSASFSPVRRVSRVAIRCCASPPVRRRL